MGTKYTTQSLTGYNSSPPVDDGTQSEANKVKWATHIGKIGDPLKTQVANMDAALVDVADIAPIAKTANYTTLAEDHQKTIEVTTATVTITLLAIASAPSGYTVIVKNNSGGNVNLDATGSETIDGSTDLIGISNLGTYTVQLNQAEDGYISLQSTSSSAGASGAGGDAVFYENDQSVNNDYTLTANKNAMSAGAITIENGVTVTVPSGATWSIV